MRKLIPLLHRVVVKLKPVEKEKTSSGGIILESSATHTRRQYATEEATVVSVGRNAFKDFGDGQEQCNVGDTVIIAQYAGVDKVDKETKEVYKILNDEDILAILGDK